MQTEIIIEEFVIKRFTNTKQPPNNKSPSPKKIVSLPTSKLVSLCALHDADFDISTDDKILDF